MDEWAKSDDMKMDMWKKLIQASSRVIKSSKKIKEELAGRVV